MIRPPKVFLVRLTEEVVFADPGTDEEIVAKAREASECAVEGILGRFAGFNLAGVRIELVELLVSRTIPVETEPQQTAAPDSAS